MKDRELDYFGPSDVDRETLMMITALDTGTTDLLAALDEGVLTLTLNCPGGSQRHVARHESCARAPARGGGS